MLQNEKHVWDYSRLPASPHPAHLTLSWFESGRADFPPQRSFLSNLSKYVVFLGTKVVFKLQIYVILVLWPEQY